MTPLELSPAQRQRIASVLWDAAWDAGAAAMGARKRGLIVQAEGKMQEKDELLMLYDFVQGNTKAPRPEE